MAAVAAAALALAGLGLAAPAAASGGLDNPTACLAQPPYPAPQGAKVVYADLEGDGTREAVAFGSRPTDSGVAFDLVALVGPDQRPVGVEIPPFGSGPEIWLRDIADVDGDGDEEVLLDSPMGASTDVMAVWGLRDCRWTQLTLAGEPIQFVWGGSVMHGDGARCFYGRRNVMLNYRSFRIGDSDRHTVTIVPFELGDLTITPIGPERTIEVTEEQLQRDWPSAFACDRAASGDTPYPETLTGEPPAATTTTTTTTKPPATTPTPVKATPSYTG